MSSRLQCVLPINLFNEKIFIFVWFWLVFMSIITIVSFITWICRTLCPMAEKNFIKNHLKAAFSEDKHEVMIHIYHRYISVGSKLLARKIPSTKFPSQRIIYWVSLLHNTPNPPNVKYDYIFYHGLYYKLHLLVISYTPSSMTNKAPSPRMTPMKIPA